MASGWRGHWPLAISLLELSSLPFAFWHLEFIPWALHFPFGFLNFAHTFITVAAKGQSYKLKGLGVKFIKFINRQRERHKGEGQNSKTRREKT